MGSEGNRGTEKTGLAREDKTADRTGDKGEGLGAEVSRSAFMAARFRKLREETSGDFLPKRGGETPRERGVSVCKLRIAIC